MKPRLLLVDNNRETADLTQQDLEKNGFQVLRSHTAREALEMVEYEQPDIIVSEVMLEKHDAGFTLAKKVKADPRFNTIPLLLLTAITEKTSYRFELEKDGYWMKADDYVEKPILIQDLVSRILRLMGKETDGTP